MEGTAAAEVAGAADGTVGDAQIKGSKENGQPAQQPSGSEALEMPATPLPRDIDWSEHFSFFNSLGGLGGSSDGARGMTSVGLSNSGSRPDSMAQRGLDDDGAEERVEELTLKNCINADVQPDASAGGSSSSGDRPAVIKGLWGNFSRMAWRTGDVASRETNVIRRPDNEALRVRENINQLSGSDAANEQTDRLGCFFDGLCKYARHSRFEVRGILKNADILNSPNVICSLSFDRDEEYFATAGVSKKIKIFEFDALLNDRVDIHYPLVEMPSKSKLSCVCWNSYIKNYLASTDYDGTVQLWDASSGQGFTQLTEHRKRAWSVSFSEVDPTKLASGSDDCCVKVWSINQKNCTDTIRNVANVCCVQFSPYSSRMLAFGSADSKIYCYDLRNTRIPWCTISGHGKAVSYVKFLDPETLISASTDNTLKIWDLNRTTSSGLSTDSCSLTLSGHTNEKNFVGLSVHDGYITCGSETNEVFSYYKSFPTPITSHKFGSIDPITGQVTNEDNQQFVSSVCWRGKSNMVVAANSSGSIKVLELV